MPLERATSSLWAIFLREKSGLDVMIDIVQSSCLETADSVLEEYRGHGDVWAVPG